MKNNQMKVLTAKLISVSKGSTVATYLDVKQQLAMPAASFASSMK